MAERVFTLLLRLFPPDFRAEYGPTLLETLRAREADARRRGRLAHARFVAREVGGLFVAAYRERRAVAGGRPSERPGGPVARVPWAWPTSGLRLALRQFRRQPLYAFACAGTLALSVAAGASSFAVVKRALLDPLPYPDDHELMLFFTDTETWDTAPVSAHVVEDLRTSRPPFDGMAPMDVAGMAWSGGGGTERIIGIEVTEDYFATVGIQPSLGGVWPSGELRAVVVTWGFWQRAMGGAPDAVGRRILLDETPYAVVGVMPETFRPPLFHQAEVMLPLDLASLLAGPGRGDRTLSLLARRAEGATPEEVAAHLEVFSHRLRSAHPDEHGRERWVVMPLREFTVGSVRPALLGTAAAAGLLLLIVAANIGGLSAARSVARRQQVAVQVALGATAGRLALQRVLDAAVVATAGSVAGLGLAWLLVGMMGDVPPDLLGGIEPVTLDAPTALLAVSLGLLVGTLAAVTPHGTVRADDGSVGGTRVAGGRRISEIRSALVVAQVALALVLVVGAGLLVRTVRHLAGTPLGFRSDGLVTMSVTLPASRYATPELQIGLEEEVLERLGRIPGVSSASASVGVPVIGGGRAQVRVADRSDEAAHGEVAFLSVSPGFIPSLGMTLRAGRGFGPQDDLDAPPVIVINESMARRFWPGGDALGARLRIGRATDDDPWMSVVGIVADVRQHGPTEAVLPTAFATTRQVSWTTRYFTVRAENAGAGLAADLRAALHAVDPSIPVGQISAIDGLVADRTARHELVMLCLTFFGTVATALSGLGLYAVVGLTSHQRRGEYAIRLALGARGRRVGWLVLRQGLALAATGTVLGLVLAVAGTRVLGGLLHGVAPLDPATFAAAGAVVLSLGALASWMPARAVGRVDPAETLNAQ